MASHEHWWLIETPKGPTSLGQCKVCSEVRVFSNRLAHDDYKRHRFLDFLSGREVSHAHHHQEDEGVVDKD